jgi:hypothetical protein
VAEEKILSLQVLLNMTVLMFFQLAIKVPQLEEMPSGIIQLLEISIVNGIKYSIMVKNPTIMVEKEKDLVLMTTTMTQSLNQPQEDS